jgi:hypothetical protein
LELGEPDLRPERIEKLILGVLRQQFSIQNLTLQKGGENKARHAFC